MGKDRYSNGIRRIALTAVFSAISLVILYIASITPSGRLGVVAAAGLFPAAAVVSGGSASGLFCYITTGMLALILTPDKSSALLFLLFFGIYPIIKHYIERLKKVPLEWLCKLLVCNAALALFWILMRTVLLAGLPASFSNLAIFWLAGNLTFVLFDIGFSKLIWLYYNRIHRFIGKM